MKKTAALSVSIFGLLCLSLNWVYLVDSQVTEPIVINRNGDVNPSYAPIYRDGNTYFLKENIFQPLVVRRDGVVFDGNGYAFYGNGTGTAINLLCSNSTIRNTYIVSWGTSILGFYANNTISQNCIVSSYFGATIYADNYSIIGNHFADCDEAIHLEGSSSLVRQNKLHSNRYGIMDPSNALGNVVVENDFQNNQAAICTWTAGLTVHHNNFVNNSYNAQIIQSENSSYAELIRFWDDGSEGNYWSGQNTPVQNIVCSQGPTIVDRYPLSDSFDVLEHEFLPLRQETPSPSPFNSQTSLIAVLTEPAQSDKQKMDMLAVEGILSVLLLALLAIAYFVSREAQTAIKPTQI
jgi:hypothetical protein